MLSFCSCEGFDEEWLKKAKRKAADVVSRNTHESQAARSARSGHWTDNIAGLPVVVHSSTHVIRENVGTLKSRIVAFVYEKLHSRAMSGSQTTARWKCFP